MAEAALVLAPVVTGGKAPRASISAPLDDAFGVADGVAATARLSWLRPNPRSRPAARPSAPPTARILEVLDMAAAPCRRTRCQMCLKRPDARPDCRFPASLVDDKAP